MSERMSAKRVESTVNRLLALLHEQAAAERELDRFRESVDPPAVPNEFPNLRAFLEYHERSQRYEEELADREARLNKAKKDYKAAHDRLRDVLPENVPLKYELVGPGLPPSQANRHVIIVNRQGELTIEER
jgi:hypothetical protein